MVMVSGSSLKLLRIAKDAGNDDCERAIQSTVPRWAKADPDDGTTSMVRYDCGT